jgi:integrase
MKKASIAFYPNKTKRNPITCKTPVYVRFTLGRKKAESRLSLDLDDFELKNWNPIISRIGLPKSVGNDHINTIEIEFKKFVSIHAHEISCMNVQHIRDRVLNRNNSSTFQNKILDYVLKYYNESVINRSSFSLGTKKNYLKAIKHLRTFLEKEGLLHLTFASFEYRHANSFKNYLIGDNPLTNKRGMTEVSASGLIQKFKTIFDQAIDESLLERNHFKKIKLDNKSPEKPRFSIDQVVKIFHLNSNRLSQLDILSRDLILFSTFTGLAFKDTIQLQKSFLEFKESGEVKLTRPRIKTNEMVEQFLTSFALQIVDKYRQHPTVSLSTYVFPRIDNSTYNKTLKTIAAHCNIPFNVTTHTGRHSFRQLLSEAEIEDIAVVKRMMGQKNRDVMDAVYYKVTESRLLEAKRKFELYLHNHFYESNRGHVEDKSEQFSLVVTQ